MTTEELEEIRNAASCSSCEMDCPQCPNEAEYGDAYGGGYSCECPFVLGATWYKEKEDNLWHDLRKNPNDLPPKKKEYANGTGEVLVSICEGDVNIVLSAYYDYSEQKWFICLLDLSVSDNLVIAWRYMPKFNNK